MVVFFIFILFLISCMSSTVAKLCCVSCGKEVNIVKCRNCWQANANDQSEVQNALTSQTTRARQQHALIQQVNDWECNAINQIRETAEKARQLIIENTTGRISRVNSRLSQLSEQLQKKPSRRQFRCAKCV